MKRIDRGILVAAIALGGFALRVARLDFQPLWWDEGYSLFFATRDFGTLLARTAVDIHPPLYYALLQFWMAIAGKSEVAVRLLSVAVGVVAIPLIYVLARQLFANTRVALTAALLLALSPLHIYYSQEVRMYGLVTLLGLASVYLFVQLYEMPAGKPKTIVIAIAYILVTTAALYTQYYAAFILAFEIIILAIHAIRSRWLTPALACGASVGSLVHWLIAFFTIALLYLPWVIYAGGKLYTYVNAKRTIEHFSPLDPITYLAQHLTAFSIGHLTDWTWLAWGSTVLVALAIGGAYAGVSHLHLRAVQVLRGMTRANGALPLSHSPTLPHTLSPTLLISLYLLIPLALGYLVNLLYPFHPIRNERLLLIAAPAFLLLVALGINALWNRRAWFGALMLVVIAALSAASLHDFYTVPRYPNDDYRPLIAEMQQLAQPGDTFLALYPWQIGYLESDYTGAALDIVEPPSDAWINDPAQMQRDLDARLATNPRVWLPALQSQGHILEDALDANLRPRTYSVVDTWFGTTRLELFQRADDPLPADQPIAFDARHTGFSPNQWGISTTPVAAGEDIVRVWFDNRDGAADTLKASLRLVDQQRNLWAQDDREIVRGTQRIGFAIPMGIPPGNYDLRFAPYRADTPAQSANDPAPSAITLARVQVIAPAQPNLAAVPNRRAIDFGDGIRLVGYDVPPTVRPGDSTPVTLFWQATRALDADYTVILQAQDKRGNVFDRTQAAPARGIYPTTRWQPNELVADPRTLTLRGDAPDGDYDLVATIFGTVKGSPSQTRIVGSITAKGRLHYFGAPTPSTTIDARFGNLARLVGYDLSSDGRNARLVLYWQALALTSTSYTVFVHAVDASGNAVAYGDAVPGNGALPTTSWIANEYLADLHEFSIPLDSPPGEYQIQVGLYDPKTGVRLPAFGVVDQITGDYIQLPTRITIK